MLKKVLLALLLLVVMTIVLNAQTVIASGYARQWVWEDENGPLGKPILVPKPGVTVFVDCWAQQDNVNGPPGRKLSDITNTNGYWQVSVNSTPNLKKIVIYTIYTAPVPPGLTVEAINPNTPIPLPQTHDFIFGTNAPTDPYQP